MKYLVTIVAVLTLLSSCIRISISDETEHEAGNANVVKNAASFAKPGIISGSVRLPDFERVVLNNGIVVLMHVKKDVPIIYSSITVRGGALADPEMKSGTSLLTAALLEKGAGNRDAREFSEATAFVGGEIDASSQRESVTITANFLKRDEDLMLELLSDMLMRPRFAAQEFDRLRTRQIELLKAARESDPRALMGTYGEAFLFGEHPYARPVGGDETTLANTSLEDVKRYYANHFGADRLIVSIAGDFDPVSMKSKLTSSFGGWRAAAQPSPQAGVTNTNNTGKVLLIDKPDATQTYFWLGTRGVNRHFDKRATLNLVNTVFGGRFTSMLNTELRVKSGLTYGARSSFSMPEQPGSLAITSYTQTDSTIAAIDLAIDTLERLHADGIEEDLADSARNYILGQFPTRLETGGQIAAYLTVLEFYGLDRDYIDNYADEIRAVSEGDISALIQSVYPRKDELVMVLIGRADAIREQVSRYGELTETSISTPGFRVK